MATPSAEARKGQAQAVASGHDDGSHRDLLTYEERRQTKLVYSDSNLHLQVGIKLHCHTAKPLPCRWAIWLQGSEGGRLKELEVLDLLQRLHLQEQI